METTKIKNLQLPSQLRENFQIAFDILKENGYEKETSSISAEDFEKDESGGENAYELMDMVNVLGFFWQVIFYKTNC